MILNKFIKWLFKVEEKKKRGRPVGSKNKKKTNARVHTRAVGANIRKVRKASTKKS